MNSACVAVSPPAGVADETNVGEVGCSVVGVAVAVAVAAGTSATSVAVAAGVASGS